MTSEKPEASLREKIARTICEASSQTWREGTYEVASGPNFEIEDHPLDPFNNHWRYKADAVLAIPEIAEALSGTGLTARP